MSANTTDDGVFGCSTVLAVAAEAGQLEATRLLIDDGADVNAVDCGGETALMYAAGAGRPAVVRLLLKRGAHVGTTDREGATALNYARRYGPTSEFDEVIRLLKAAAAQ